MRRILVVLFGLLVLVGVVSPIPVQAQAPEPPDPTDTVEVFTAVDDVEQTEPGEPVTIDVIDNDGAESDDNDTVVTVVSPPGSGSAVAGAEDGEPVVVYTPAAGFGGVTSFTYQGCVDGVCDDATVTVYVGTGACTIVGTSGADTLTGTAGADVICGRGGADVIDGRGGADIVFAGNGNDTVNGGGGDDVIHGGNGNDVVDGDAGNDTIRGGRGDDELRGSAGDDQLFGGRGGDTLRGNNGNDLAVGGAGADLLEGGNGNDTLRGWRGDDTINGGANDDVIYGGRGADSLNGDTGNDTIHGRRGDDTLNGGDGADQLFGNRGNDTLNGGPGTDTLNGGNGTNTCVDGETNTNCGDDPIDPGPEPEVVEVLDPPLTPVDADFVKETEAGGAEILVYNSPGVYPFDVLIRPVVHDATSSSWLASTVVDLQANDAAPSIGASRLTIRYNENALAGIAESDARIWTLDTIENKWQLVPGQQLVDPERNEVTAELQHFSCYAVLNVQAPADLTDASTCSGLPEPNWSTGGVQVPGANIAPSTLLQPAELGNEPALTSRLVASRLPSGQIAIQRVSFDRTVLYDSNLAVVQSSNCGVECQALANLPTGSFALAVAGQALFADDGDNVMSSNAVREQVQLECVARGAGPIDQCSRWAEGAPSGQAAGFLDWIDWKPSVDCPISLDIDCLGEERVFKYNDFGPADLTGLLDLVTGTNAAILRSPASMRMLGKPDGKVFGRDEVRISPESLNDVTQWSDFLRLAFQQWGTLETELGASFALDELLANKANPAFSSSLRTSVDWLEQNRPRLQDNRTYLWMLDLDSPFGPQGNTDLETMDLEYVQVTMIRLQAFQPGTQLPADLLLSMPSVTDVDGPGAGFKPYADTDGLDIRRLTGFEPQLIVLLDEALRTIDAQDRSTQHEAVFRLPETYSGIRNDLITAMYYEYGHAVQVWADGAAVGTRDSDLRPAVWGSVAAWASTGIGPVIRGELPWLADLADAVGFASSHEVRQDAADGNQWIFADAVRHYADLIDLIETNPNPSIQQWEDDFFAADRWENHDQIAREGMTALVASRFATERSEQQRLMFLHTAMFGDIEQQGAQRYLEAMRTNASPDEIAAIFINLQMGSVRLDVDVDLSGPYLVDLSDLARRPSFAIAQTDGDEARDVNHDPAFWELDLVCYQTTTCVDPSRQRSNSGWLSANYDSAIDFNFGQAPSDDAVDMSLLQSYPNGPGRGFYTPTWDEWRDGADAPNGTAVYAGTGAGTWPDWGERMWYLFNMFRLSLMDPAVKQPPYPYDRGGPTDGTTFRNQPRLTDTFPAATISKLKVTTFDNNVPPIDIEAVNIGITTTSLPDGISGTTYPATQLEPANYGTWELVSGAPDGLTLSPTGVLSGTPNGGNAYNVTVRLDTGSRTVSRAFPMFIAGPRFDTDQRLPDGKTYEAYNAAIVTTVHGNVDETTTLAVTDGALPAGLDLDPATGVITGTPTSAGTSLFTLTATDSDGYTASREFSVTIGSTLSIVVSVNPDPVLTGADASAQFTLINRGANTAAGYAVRFRLPSEFTGVAAPGCTLAPATVNTYDCLFADLPSDTQTSVVVGFEVPAGYDLTGKYIDYQVGLGAASLASPLRYPLFREPTLPSIPCLDGCLMARSTGDPHLVTLDGYPYDLQTVGETVWTRTVDGSVEIQARTSPWRTSTTVSINTAVAARVGSHRVGLYIGDGVLIDGVPTGLESGASIDLGGGAYVSRTGENYLIVWPGTGDRPRLSVRIAGDHLDLTFAAPTSMAGTFVGLLGDGDGSQANEFALADGSPLPSVTAQALHTTFADSWRVTDTNTLFDYPAGLTTADFTDLDYPTNIVQLSDFTPAVIAAARRQCEQAGVTNPIVRDSCALDLIITQDPSFLASFIGAVLPTGVGPLNTLRDVNGDPVLITGSYDIEGSPDGSTVYLSVPTENKVVAFDTITGERSDYATITAPTFMHVTDNGDLYVVTRGQMLGTNVGDGYVTRVDAATGTQTVVGSGLLSPTGVAVGDDGTLYVIQTGYDYFGEPWNSRLTTVDGTSSTIIASLVHDPSRRAFDLSIDDVGTLWFYGVSPGNPNLRSWNNGVVTEYGGLPGLRYAAGGNGIVYYAYNGGSFPGCHPGNTSQVFRRDFTDPAAVDERVAGTVEGFLDGDSYNDPYGRLCRGEHAMDIAAGRLWIRDEANNAIRYLAIN